MAGTQKVLDKLQRNLEAGSFYEAQQMFKTVYYRYRAQKKTQDSYRLCEEGARLQLQKGQLNCGAELALLLIEAFQTDKLPCTLDSSQAVLHVLEAFPQPKSAGSEAEAAIKSCSQVAGAAIKWACRCPSATSDASIQRLHDRVAAYIWELTGWQGLGQASQHFARGTDTTAFAAALVQAATEGSKQEEDLFLTRGALQLLAVRRPTDAAAAEAAAAARSLLQSVEAINGRAVPDTPLMHFADLYIQALGKRSLPLCKVLRREYSASLARDSHLQTLLDQAEEVHLGVEHGAGGMGGLMADLMSMLTDRSEN